ncbi:hypothetical protein [Veillonella sp. T11011-6]|uniref:hypothetical protein n=1 Tax=Veillonella sp. T11011-6 TaxID=2027459 RepID=UPI000CF4CDF3|nr:hypothetical protein [Veillonella sp. T11011-6]PQL09626.1 hypothetical protein VRHSUH10_08655 [Veillonella sp. T11011-6]
MAEYNGVTLEPLMDGSQDRDYQVEQFIFWGAGRAAALALSPKFSSVALCANATYMVTRIAHLYEVELQSGAVVGLVGGLSTAVGTAAISLLVPLKAVRVPVAVGLTYAIGKIAHIWIQDGMPSDIERYKPMVAEFLESGKAIAGDIIRDAGASIPFTQGQRDVWAGIANETGLAKETLKQVYEEKVTPAIDKWNTETKYQLHDNAAEVVAKVSDAAKDKIDAAKENIDVAKELAKGGVEVAKASAQAAVETAKTKANDAVETAKDVAVNTVNTAKDKIGGLRK